MKHLRNKKQIPAKAFWFRWYFQIANSEFEDPTDPTGNTLINIITFFVNALYNTIGGFDIRDV
jgi:hypothetical protein